MKESRSKDWMSYDEVLTEDIMGIAADMIQTEIDSDIVAHEQMDIDIPRDFDNKMLEMARKMDSERKAKQQGEKCTKQNRIFRIAAIFLICIISASCITMVTSEAFRKKVIQLFTNQTDGAVTLRNGDEEELIGDWEKFWYPAVLPDGFYLIAAEETDHFMLYANAEKALEFRIFEQPADFMISVDTDTTEMTPVSIGYYEGYLFELKDMDCYCVIWRTESQSIVMYFDGAWSQDNVLQIAEEVTYIDKN